MKKVLVIILVFLVLIAGGAAFVGMNYIKGLDKAFDPSNETVTMLEIPAGSSTGDIGAILEEAGIIQSAKKFQLYSRIHKLDSGYMAGTYGFSPSMKLSQIAEDLTTGRTSTVQFTVPEGLNINELADTLSSQGMGSYEKFLELAANGDFDYDFLKDAPEGVHRLEGYLFPETYTMPYGCTEYEILDTMLSHFDKMYTDEYKARAKELGLTTNEVITIASIIEEECALDEERPLVSSVIYNRLDLDMPLGMDSTILFILGEHRYEVTYAETEIDSPYNTYLYPGLPIGPISSPGLASIEAALYPAETDLLYFVVSDKGDGSMVYSNNYEDFISAVDAFDQYLNEQNND